MKKSELKSLIQEVIREYNHDNNIKVLREYFNNDLRKYGLNEGISDSIKSKLVQPLVSFLVKKLEKEDPKRFNILSTAVANNDKDTLESLFDDPKIDSEEKKITNQILQEYAMPLSEEDEKPSMLKSVWNYVKNNPKLSTVAILALLSLVGFAVYSTGGIAALLLGMAKSGWAVVPSGAIGGGAISGVKSVYQQTKDGGSVNPGQLAKDVAKGTAVGAATSFIGGGLGYLAGQAAQGAASLSGIVAALINGNPGEVAFAKLIKDPKVQALPENDVVKKYIKKWTKDVAQGRIPPENLLKEKENLEFLRELINKGEIKNATDLVSGVNGELTDTFVKDMTSSVDNVRSIIPKK